MEQFWNTIAAYNLHTWPLQALIVTAGIVLTLCLYRRPSRSVKIAMKAYVIFLNVWISTVYYLIFCRERPYSGALAMLWGMMAVIWLYDAVTGYTSFERTRKHDSFACALLAMPFIYPAVSLLRGMGFPMMTSPVMPCSVAVFTIGILLAFSKRVNLFIVLFLCHWALIGVSKIYFFHIPEDALLACAVVPAIYMFLREYISVNISERSKPDIRTVNLLLTIMCIGIGLLFTAMIWQQFADAAA